MLARLGRSNRMIGGPLSDENAGSFDQKRIPAYGASLPLRLRPLLFRDRSFDLGRLCAERLGKNRAIRRTYRKRLF